MKVLLLICAVTFAGTRVDAAECVGRKGPSGWEGEVTCPWPWGKVDTVANYKAGKLEGVRKSFAANGTLKALENFKAGVLEGPASHYSEDNGNLQEERNYKKGNLHGVTRTFFPEGKVESVVSYRDGKKHGSARQFYKDGTLRELTTYEGDSLHGAFEKYNEEGRPTEKGQWLDNTTRDGEHAQYYVNGKPMYLTSYLNGRRHGLFKKFHDNGTLLETNCFQNDAEVQGLGPCLGKGQGEETVRSLFGNGKVAAEYQVAGGKRSGFSRTYHANGQVRELANYANDLLDGEMKRYREGGELESELQYKAGALIGLEKHYHATGKPRLMIEWGKQGKVVERESYENGKPQTERVFAKGGGHLKEFYDNGILAFECTYTTGGQRYWWRHENCEGRVTSFAPDGALVEEIWFKNGVPHGDGKRFLNGKLTAKSAYQDGRVVSRTTYDKEGKILISEAYHADGSRK